MSYTPNRALPNGLHCSATATNGYMRAHVPGSRDGSQGGGLGAVGAPEEEEREEDAVHVALKARWAESEASIAALFAGEGRGVRRGSRSRSRSVAVANAAGSEESAKPPAPAKKAARTIDEDDYGDEDEEDEIDEVEKETPLKGKGAVSLPNGIASHVARSPVSVAKPPVARTNTTGSTELAKPEDVRKQLEEDKKAAAEAAKRDFQTMFFTFENDRDAMLEQQKQEELDRDIENELSGDHDGASAAQPTSAPAVATQGSLGSADLGASSLTLKHLIARIDHKRDMVKASDTQLRTLISEVRKGRSKWASEERVGQEELYEAAEKVLLELKAMSEYAQPFLSRVSKREAPDYYNVIKSPMDIGTMIKKLKQLQYKSKTEFTTDLGLIWSNCLKYNSAPELPIRKKALYMRKETDKLIPLIPDITVRDRAELEAEERRLQSADADDSDEDDAPIMASRGRKAPKKGGKSAPSSARKALPTINDEQSTPQPDTKLSLHTTASHLRNEFLRADSETHDASSAGFGTPPPAGSSTPLLTNGVHTNGASGSQPDLMEVDGLGNSVLGSAQEDPDEDDTDFKTWKQVTMKDRALAAAERNRLFRGEHLNPDEPALLRSKAGMRRWQRQQKLLSADTVTTTAEGDAAESDVEPAGTGETLAEGIEKDEDSTLPDYYGSLSAIPELDDRWKWTTDSEGNVVPQGSEYLRMFPKDQFKPVDGGLTRRMEGNIRQMQETRKVCAKIGIVKQMQIQAQTYQNQFQKYDPEPFLEADVGTVVVSEDGPIMAPWVCKAALKRSVGKIFYHAGFEDFQPSALDAVTDLAGEFFMKLAGDLKEFSEQPPPEAGQPRFTHEEQILHTLHENGQDVEAIETYVKDDVERLTTKLGVVHERMKAHLADLLRPALGDHAGADGVGAFNDGSEQFLGGDFAEDLDEDFFGFRELGLMEEFGLQGVSVPLHLLRNRIHNGFQAQNAGPVAVGGQLFESPEAYDAISVDALGGHIGLVQGFFRERLRKNHDEALVEDEDLPQKQRFPKPRLPPTGKISSPRKRPIREQQQAAKKKRKLDEESKLMKPIGSLKLTMPERDVDLMDVDPEKDGGLGDGAMISPESLTAS
ncbi:Transcriptional activator spt7 [Oleoguttula sp. CCFEE 5521]